MLSYAQNRSHLQEYRKVQLHSSFMWKAMTTAASKLIKRIELLSGELPHPSRTDEQSLSKENLEQIQPVVRKPTVPWAARSSREMDIPIEGKELKESEKPSKAFCRPSESVKR